METTIKLTDEITAAACQLARIAARQGDGEYNRGYVAALGDLLAILNIGGDLPAGDPWDVSNVGHVDQVMIAEGDPGATWILP